MDIRNASQFANFLHGSGLTNKDSSFQEVVFYNDRVAKSCKCWKAEDRQKLYDQCTAAYRNAVRNVVPRFKNDFLSKTDDRQIQFFLDNGSLIGIVCR